MRERRPHGNVAIKWIEAENIKPIRDEEEWIEDNTDPDDPVLYHLHSGRYENVETPRRCFAVEVTGGGFVGFVDPRWYEEQTGKKLPAPEPDPYQGFWVKAEHGYEALAIAALYAGENGMDVWSVEFLP